MPEGTSTRGREGGGFGPVNPVATSPRPLRTIVMAAIAAVLVVLLTLVAPLPGVVAAAICAVGFLASLRLVGTAGWRSASPGLVSLLLLVVGSGFAFAIGYTLLELISVLFPVSTVSLIQPLGLEAVSATAAVATGTVGLVGCLTTLAGGIRPDKLRRTAANGKTAARVTGVVSGAVLVVTALFRSPTATVPAVDPVVPLLDGVFAPAPNEIHLFSFAGLVLIAASTIVAEIAKRRTATDGTMNAATPAVGPRRVAQRLSGPRGALGIAVAFGSLEILVPSNRIALLLPGWLGGFLRALTTSTLLRYAIVAVLAGTVLLAGLRRVERAMEAVIDGEEIAFVFPIVGGFVIVLATALGHGFVLDALLAGVEERLPLAYGTEFAERTDELIGFYGPLALGLVLATVAVRLGAALAAAIALLDRAASLPRPGVSPALATAGVFATAAFAVGVEAPPPLVLGGIFVAIVGWDVLLFEERIHREGGETALVHRPAAVHALGSLLVGGFGFVGALLAFELAPEAPAAAGETVPFALFAVLIGIASLIFAVRR